MTKRMRSALSAAALLLAVIAVAKLATEAAPIIGEILRVVR